MTRPRTLGRAFAHWIENSADKDSVLHARPARMGDRLTDNPDDDLATAAHGVRT